MIHLYSNKPSAGRSNHASKVTTAILRLQQKRLTLIGNVKMSVSQEAESMTCTNKRLPVMGRNMNYPRPPVFFGTAAEHGRPPGEWLIATPAWADLCHALINAKEFIFVQ